MALRNHVISIDLRLGQTNFNSQIRNFQDGVRGMFDPSYFQLGGWLSTFNIIERAGIAAFSAISNGLEAAIDYQTSFIGQAGNLSNVFRSTYGEGAKLAKAFNTQDAKSNAGLPFATLRNRFRSIIGDDALTAFGNTQAGVQRSVDFLGKAAIAFGSVPGVTEFQRQNAASGFITAKTKKDLSRQELFRDPVIKRSLDQAEIQTGINFDTADTNSRFLLMEAFVNKIATPEMIKRYQNTLGGTLEGIKNNLLNPEIGLLSFNRELTEGKANTSVIGALTNLFIAATKIDGSGFKLFTDDLLGFAVNSINFITAAIENGFGRGLLKGFGAIGLGIFDGIKSAILGLTIALNFVLVPLDILFSTFGFLTPVVQYLTASFTALLVVASARFAFNWATSLLFTLGRIASIEWSALFNGLLLSSRGVAIFNGSLLTLLANPVVLTGAAIIGALALAGFTLYKFWKPLKGFFQGFWEGFTEALSPSIQSLSIFNDVLNNIKIGLSPIIEGFRAIARTMQPVMTGIGSFFNMNQYDEGTKPKSIGQSLGRAVGRGFTPDFRNLIPGFGIGRMFGLFGGNNADGNDLGKALANESRQMPNGSNTQLAVLNSSEAILNRDQQNQIKNNRGISLNPTFNITGSNAEEIADVIESRLEQMLNNVYRNSSLRTT